MNEYSEVLEYIKRKTIDLQSIIPESLDAPEIPEFKDIRQRRVLYTHYGEAVEKTYIVANALANIHTVRSIIKATRRQAHQDKDTPRSLLEPIKAELDYWDKRTYDVVEGLTSYKDAVDSLARFYSSAQYILGSPRLDGLE